MESTSTSIIRAEDVVTLPCTYSCRTATRFIFVDGGRSAGTDGVPHAQRGTTSRRKLSIKGGEWGVERARTAENGGANLVPAHRASRLLAYRTYPLIKSRRAKPAHWAAARCVRITRGPRRVRGPMPMFVRAGARLSWTRRRLRLRFFPKPYYTVSISRRSPPPRPAPAPIHDPYSADMKRTSSRP